MNLRVGIVSLMCLFFVAGYAKTTTEITSPDGKYRFVFSQKAENGAAGIYYELFYEGLPVITESRLGVQIDNRLFELALGIPEDTCAVWSDNLLLQGEQRRSQDRSRTPVYGERSVIRDHYNELTLSFVKGAAQAGEENGYDKRRYYNMDLVIRAYNEGVAFRYHFPETANGLFLNIKGELTEFAFEPGAMAWYERWAQGPYHYLPLEGWTDECERPLTLKLANGLTVSLMEAQMVDYARMKFSLCADKPNTLRASLYDSVNVISPYSTPWRVIRAAKNPAELIAGNDMILNLNPECKIEDTSWIKPGKVIRVASLTQADALQCVDFAAERGLQYIHLDAGWYGPEMQMASDATTVSPQRDLDIPALTAYAAGKGIGVTLYVNQRALAQQLDEILPLYKEWGIKGIKFGFVQVGSQKWTAWLHEAVAKCAEYGMMVDIHDEYRPTGFSRTYPNLMTQEGIRGNEEMPDATHNTILPFTRFLAGAGDYTVCYYNNRIKTTHAHQLALSVIYYSPLQFLYWYDKPSAYNGEPEIEFFDRVQTVWDQTQPIGGQPGEYALVARRSGDEWFVGGITNNDAREMALSPDFLEPGRKYIASVYTDDDTAATRTKVRVSRHLVDGNTRMEFSVKASGGFAVHFAPAAAQKEIKKYERTIRF